MTKQSRPSKSTAKFNTGDRVTVGNESYTIIGFKLRHLYVPKRLTIPYFLYKVVSDKNGKIQEIAEGHIGKKLEDKTQEQIKSILTTYAVV